MLTPRPEGKSTRLSRAQRVPLERPADRDFATDRRGSCIRMTHRWLPKKDRLLQTRWLRPLAHRLGDEHLWILNRKSVARAVSIGLFFGLLLPFAQILFAVALAIVMRGHVNYRSHVLADRRLAGRRHGFQPHL